MFEYIIDIILSLANFIYLVVAIDSIELLNNYAAAIE
jgi:hypothetical protein